MYDVIRKKLARGETIILDGGTGTDIQRRGVPMSSSTWCAEANVSHPEVVRAVHEDYIRAGADIIIANTFATSALLFNALGRDDELLVIDRAAVAIARRRCVNTPAISTGNTSSAAKLNCPSGSSRRSSEKTSRSTPMVQSHCRSGPGLAPAD